jgi:MFS family permease
VPNSSILKSVSAEARLLLKISYLTTFAESMLVPMYTAFTEQVGGSILDAGIAFAVFSIATGAVIGLVGTRPWFQKHVRSCLAAGFLISACCDLAYILVGNKWQLFGVQTIAGLASGLIEPAWDSLFTDDIEHSSAKHWSIWAGGSHVVAGAAALIGGAIVAGASFTVLFVAMCLFDSSAFIVAWRGRHPPRVASEPAA